MAMALPSARPELPPPRCGQPIPPAPASKAGPARPKLHRGPQPNQFVSRGPRRDRRQDRLRAEEWEEAFQLVAANYRARGYEVAIVQAATASPPTTPCPTRSPSWPRRAGTSSPLSRWSRTTPCSACRWSRSTARRSRACGSRVGAWRRRPAWPTAAWASVSSSRSSSPSSSWHPVPPQPGRRHLSHRRQPAPPVLREGPRLRGRRRLQALRRGRRRPGRGDMGDPTVVRANAPAAPREDFRRTAALSRPWSAWPLPRPLVRYFASQSSQTDEGRVGSLLRSVVRTAARAW